MSPPRLSGIAHTMAALVPLYGRKTGEQELRPLTEGELLSGRFRNEGAELHFLDGRAPLLDIAATHHGIG
jgi:hypothetical protein